MFTKRRGGKTRLYRTKPVKKFILGSNVCSYDMTYSSPPGKDVCACAATGTGKTAAYMLPILERLLYKAGGAARVTRVLVLVPTRELGAQVGGL